MPQDPRQLYLAARQALGETVLMTFAEKQHLKVVFEYVDALEQTLLASRRTSEQMAKLLAAAASERADKKLRIKNESLVGLPLTIYVNVDVGDTEHVVELLDAIQPHLHKVI